MVEQSDRAPLLDWEEIPPPDPNQAGPPPPQPPREEDAPAEKSSQPAGRRTPTGTAVGTGWSSSSSATTTTTAIATTCSPSRNVTAVVASGDGSPGRPRTDLCGHGWNRPEPLGTDRNVPFPGLSVRDQWEEKDQIVAVFVVTFDTRSGERANGRKSLRSVTFHI